MCNQGVVLKAFPDFCVRIDDAREHGAEIIALITGEVRADLSAFVKEFVAGCTEGGVEFFAGVDVSISGLDDGFNPLDFLLHRLVGGGFGFAKIFTDPSLYLWVFLKAKFVDDFRT